MALPDLSRTGWHIAATGTPATRFQVFGERSSGTHFLRRLIARNSPLEPTEALGWTHGFPAMAAIPADTAIIAVVRRADDWSLSMHRKPWHTPPAMQRMPFDRFIRAEWLTIADRMRYFPQVAELGGVGEPLQSDRHPLTGLPFANLFRLRTAKLIGLLSFAARGCSYTLVQLEAVQARPEAFLAALLPALGQPAFAPPLRPVVKHLGSKFKPSVRTRPATPAELAPTDLAFLREQVDPRLEERLGYRYGP